MKLVTKQSAEEVQQGRREQLPAGSSAVLDGERVRRVGARMKAAEPLQVKSL